MKRCSPHVIVRLLRWPAVAAAGMAVSASAAPTPTPAPVDPMVCAADHAPGCTSPHTGNRRLDLAIDAYCRDAEDPAAKREEVLRLLRETPMCFSPIMTGEQFEHIMNQLQALPPTAAQEGGLRFFVGGQIWTATGQQSGLTGRATPASLSISFPDDGVQWDGGANTLNANLSAVFGAANKDKGRELIRQAFAGWRRVSALTYYEIGDNNSPMDNSIFHSTIRGDIRIGARPLDGVNGVLAYNYFPSGGGDMVIDANDFSGNFNSSFSNYRFFRNVVAHEHGHGLGFFHSTPCLGTKLMEPFAGSGFEMVQVDEIRGAGRHYGDRFAGNHSAATAKDFGNLTSPVLRSVIERNLSTNGAAGAGNTGEDWFKFTISTPQNVTITVDPTGGSYQNGQQTSGCNPNPAPVINADQAGNLNAELRDSAGASVVLSSTGAAAGANEVISAAPLAAGTYTLRVFDVGPNAATNQTAQLYDLTIRVATSKAPPVAIAGIHKRIPANTTCFFMGNINSYTTDTDAANGANSITTYAWDLDGDGTFEIPNNPQPTRTYAVNGIYNVTLRVTDENGLTATDTIQVSVVDGPASVGLTSVAPASGMRSQTVPVTLIGTGLTSVTSASNVTVSGTGITVTGTPNPDQTGTQVTGLSFIINAAAPLGPRDVTVTTAEGSDIAAGAFTVNVNTLPDLTGLSPNFGRQGFTVPVTLTGTNLSGITAASNVTVGGTGITVTGTPSVSPDGTTVTGLSFVVAPNAQVLVLREVSITTPGGSDVLGGAFRVRCLADWNGDSGIAPSDVAAYINDWFTDIQNGQTSADVDHDGDSDPSDVALFINTWFNTITAGC